MRACGEQASWRVVFAEKIVVQAAADGRHIGICVAGLGDWYRCGSERGVRAALARVFWDKRKAGADGEGVDG